MAKYSEVIGTLEFARELSGQFNKLAIDEAKDKKKMMKKEQQERARVELVKVMEFSDDLNLFLPSFYR